MRTLDRVEELKAARMAVQLAGREKRRLARHLNRAQRIARVGSWEWERATNRVVCSAELQRMLGLDAEHLVATPAALLPHVHADDRRAFRRWLADLARGRAAPGLDARVSTRSGEFLQVRMMGEAVGIADGSASGVVGTVRDATEHAEAIHEVHQLAYYDVLTELPNRARFHERLVETLDFASRTSASIGIVLYPRDGNSLDTLLGNADVAMYNAKVEGRNRHAFYRESMREVTAQRLSLEHDLRRAIEAEQVVLHYQPQIDVTTGAVVGVEALVRWNHPTLGLLPPSEFIPVAEEAGLIMAIWEWVFVTALIQHNDWVQDGLPAIAVGVNLSSVQFADTALAGRVKEIAEVVGVPLDCIELEITESALMGDFDTALATLNALREMGVAIAIDDFGTGYSSLSYLRRLPLRKLKLDIAFIRDAVESDEAAAIVAAIISIANSLKLDVVAEGVETQAQCDFLVESGCTTMQGYLLSRPVTGQAIADLLRGGRSRAIGECDTASLQLQ